VRCARVHFSGGGIGADGRGLRAKGGAGFSAEPGDSCGVRVGDHAAALRCEGEAAEVQKRAGDLPGRVRADCGGESRAQPQRALRGTEEISDEVRGQNRTAEAAVSA